MANLSLAQKFRAARQASTPLVAVQTPDPRSTIDLLTDQLDPQDPILIWDCATGLRGGNKPGELELDRLRGFVPPGSKAPFSILLDDRTEITHGDTVLRIAQYCAPSTVLFMHQMQRHLDSIANIQGIWNLRDRFKTNKRTMVLLCAEGRMPPELQQDVIVLDEPLPDAEQLRALLIERFEGLSQQCDGAWPVPDQSDPEVAGMTLKAVHALRGLSAFAAEQVVYMALTHGATPRGLLPTEFLAALWDYKCRQIEETRGIEITRSTVHFDQIGGLTQIKGFLSNVFQGEHAPSAIVFLDELEKMLAGSNTTGGDSSGVSQDSLGVILRAMEDYEWSGAILVGVPGAGKSLLAKSAGATHQVPTCSLDLSACRGSLVGESEAAIRQMIKTIHGIAGDGAFLLGTCNKLDALPAELLRRFRGGIWFFDLPTVEERESIWQLNLVQYGLEPTQARPDDTDWTGAEIRNICELARNLKQPLVQVAQYIVPVAQSAPQSIAILRQQAAGHFLSASYSGRYRLPVTPAVESSEPASTNRKLTFADAHHG